MGFAMKDKEKDKLDSKSSHLRHYGRVVTPTLTVLIFIMVTIMFFKMQGMSSSLSGQMYSEDQKMDAKVSLMNEKMDEMSNRLAVIAETGGGAGLGGADLRAVEKINVKADKYHIIFLTKEIVERINNTKDYSDKLIELKKLVGGKFPDQIVEIEKNKAMSILNHDEMVKIVEESTVSSKGTAEPEKGTFDSIKGVFKVSSKEDDLKVKCNPVIIDAAIKNLREKNEWEALKTLEQVQPQNEGLKKVVDNLNLRNVLKYYVNQIADETLKNG